MPNFVRCLAASTLLLAALDSRAQANDDWANRTPITLPFAVGETQMQTATVEAGDPDPPCRPLNAPVPTNTLWYGYTTGATTEYLTLRVTNSQVLSIVSVYTGDPAGGFRIVSGGCSSISDDQRVSIAGLRLAPNTSYSIEVGAILPPNAGNVLDFSVAAAAIYAVTKTADSNDGTCDADCSLREAIGASNTTPGAVLIPAGTYAIGIAGANETLNATGGFDLLRGMGVYGAGMQLTTIDALASDRVLTLDPPSFGTTHAAFSLGDLTLTRGEATASQTQTHGGGALLLDSGTDYFGFERVAAVSSHATKTGGGMTIGSPGTLRDCVIADNTADYFGGGGLYLGTDNTRYIEISGSTISGNSITDQAGGAGGGVYVHGTLRVSNSTISGNHAIGDGGGIMVEGSGSLQLASSTVVLNTAQTNPNRSDAGAGVNLSATGPSSIVDSVIAYNAVANPTDPPDCALWSTTLTTRYNHVGSSGGSCGFTGAGDVTGTDPGLSHTLAANGGPTKTHAMLAGSAALDSADPAGCADAAGSTLAYDQRGAGFARALAGRCDKGAVEGIDPIFRDGFE